MIYNSIMFYLFYLTKMKWLNKVKYYNIKGFVFFSLLFFDYAV